MQTTILATADLSVCLYVRHVLVFCPDEEDTIVRVFSFKLYITPLRVINSILKAAV